MSDREISRNEFMSDVKDLPKSNSLMIRHLGRVAGIIFALAMAQCILGFQVPETAKSFTEKEVFDFLLAQLEPLTAYAVAFIVVGFYWIDHVKRFRYYKQTNEIHLWICLLYLMGLFLIPYSNALVIFFAENLVAKVWFSTNTAFIGFLSFFELGLCNSPASAD